MLYISCSTNLKDDPVINIFVRHFSYVSFFIFSHACFLDWLAEQPAGESLELHLCLILKKKKTNSSHTWIFPFTLKDKRTLPNRSYF